MSQRLLIEWWLPTNTFGESTKDQVTAELKAILEPVYSGAKTIHDLESNAREKLAASFYHKEEIFIDIFNSAPNEEFKIGLLTCGGNPSDSILFPALYGDDSITLEKILTLAHSLSPQGHQTILECQSIENSGANFGNAIEYTAAEGAGIECLNLLIKSAELLKARNADFNVPLSTVKKVGDSLEGNIGNNTKNEIIKRLEKLQPKELALA
jgi:hypothetical protein